MATKVRKRPIGAAPSMPAGADLYAISRPRGASLSPLNINWPVNDGTSIYPGNVQVNVQPGSPGSITIPPIPINLPQFQAFIDPAQLQALIDATRKWQGNINTIAFTVGVAPQLILPASPDRAYFMIVNTGAANRIFVGFGNENVNANTGLPIGIGLGSYEATSYVPLNDVYVVGAAANSTGIILYGV